MNIQIFTRWIQWLKGHFLWRSLVKMTISHFPRSLDGRILAITLKISSKVWAGPHKKFVWQSVRHKSGHISLYGTQTSAMDVWFSIISFIAQYQPACFSIRKFAPKLGSKLLINLALILVQNLRWKHLSSLFPITVLSTNLGSNLASCIFVPLLVSPFSF